MPPVSLMSARGGARSRGRRREGAPEQLAADATNVNIPAAEAVQHGGTHVVQQASAPRRRDTSANAMASGVAGNTAAVMKTATSNQPAAPVTGNAAVKTAQSKPAHNAKAVPLVQTVPPPAAQGSATKPSGLPARVALPSAGLPGHAAVQHGVPRGGAANAKPAGATLLAPARNEAQPRARGANYKDWTCDEVCSWAMETLRKEAIPGEAAIVAAFRAQGIKGSHLAMLSPGLLRDELGFGMLGNRLSFLQARDKLMEGEAKDSGTGRGQHLDAKGMKKIEDMALAMSSLQDSMKRISLIVEEMALKRGLPSTSARFSAPTGAVSNKQVEVKQAATETHRGTSRAVAASSGAIAAAGSVKGAVTGTLGKVVTAGGEEEDSADKGAARAKEGGKDRWTHFVALPVESRAVLANLARVQGQVSAVSPALVPGLIPPNKFHASLAIICCEDETALARARAALQACAREFAVLFEGARGARFRVKGLGHFRNSVLWAGVEDAKTLQAMATLVQKHLRQAGPGVQVQVQGRDNSEVVALQGHVTLMKTTFFSAKQRAALTKADKNFDTLCGPWKTCDFGVETASVLQLCAMKTRTKGGVAGGGEGGYVVDGFVLLPPAFNRLPSVVSWNYIQALPVPAQTATARCIQVVAAARAQDGSDKEDLKVRVELEHEDDGHVKVKIKVLQGVAEPNESVAEPKKNGEQQKKVDGVPHASVRPREASGRVHEASDTGAVSGSRKQRDSHEFLSPAATVSKPPAPSVAKEGTTDLRQRIASAVEDAVLAAYSFQIKGEGGDKLAGWSAGMTELEHAEEQVRAQLAVSGKACVPYAYSPQHLDACMMVDISISHDSAAGLAAKTREWAENVERAWAMAASNART